MTQAIIKINGSDGSDDDLPIATLVSLDNDGNGGELTYLWSILSQPSGTADVLSSTTIHNPTFTPNKEGTYLIQLVVNDGLPDQAIATAIVGIRDLKTNQRIPAPFETSEDGVDGWADAANSVLQVALAARSDSNLIVCWSHSGAVLNQLVKFGGTHVLKSGLPGQETIALTAAAGSSSPIGAIVGPCVPDGPVSNALVFVRVLGLFENTLTGSPTVGDPVFIDTGTSLPSLTGSTEIGRVVLASGGSYRYAVRFPPGGGGGGLSLNQIGVINEPFGAAALSDGSKVYVSALNDSVLVLEGTSIVDAILVGESPNAIAITSDGAKAYVCNGGSNTVSVIDLSDNSVVATVVVGDGPFALALQPDDSHVFVCNFDDSTATTVSVIDTSDNSVTFTVQVGSNPQYIECSPDGAVVYVACNGDGIVYAINTGDFTVAQINVTGGAGTISGLAISPDSATIYVSDNTNNRVAFISASGHTITESVDVGNTPVGPLVLLPDGSKLYVYNASDNTTSAIDVATHSVTATIANVGGFWLAATPDSTKVYAVDNADNEVKEIVTSTDTVGATIATTNPANSLFVTPDGGHVYVLESSSMDVITVSGNTIANVADGISYGTITELDLTSQFAVTPLGGGGVVLAIDTQQFMSPASVPLTFFLSGLGASADQTVPPMNYMSDNMTTWTSDRPGSIVGISLAYPGGVAAGNMTLNVTIDGNPTTLELVYGENGNDVASMRQVPGIDTFFPTSKIGVHVSTDSEFVPGGDDVNDLYVWISYAEQL